MYSVAAWALALALICVAAALMLWRHAEVKRVRTGAQRFIDSRIEPAARAAARPMPASPPQHNMPSRDMPPPAARNAPSGPFARWRAAADEYLAQLTSRAGIEDARGKMVAAIVTLAAIALLAGSRGGALAFIAALAGGISLLWFWLASRIQRRRLRIVQQIPSFLDGIVRLVTLGNSVPAAFQAALLTTEAPLRGCLDHVSRMLRTGVEIDRAMMHISQVYRTREFELVGSVLRLSVKYGGRADVMLDRMAVFMRDLEQAERELMALSSETRLSALVLMALPVAIGGFVVATNPSYLHGMWIDPTGRPILFVAFVLQLVGAACLYRMARLR
ncbi:type II secretion system F family protein [Burkholderia guangdongensis]|uniref:type II secretion system F family protein n=1 Tax=Burkholderia guangdongensis TaxID=1792500 RepID=UPI0015C8A52C|nr:type II secretion system F family protein [Burkholderia guangdongensis]